MNVFGEDILEKSTVMLVAPNEKLCNLTQSLNYDYLVMIIDFRIFTQNTVQIPTTEVNPTQLEIS